MLAGPIAAAIALVALTAMPIYIPAGPDGVDNLVIPLLLLPIVWAVLFFHAVLDGSLIRVALIGALLAAASVMLIAARFRGWV